MRDQAAAPDRVDELLDRHVVHSHDAGGQLFLFFLGQVSPVRPVSFDPSAEGRVYLQLRRGEVVPRQDLLDEVLALAKGQRKPKGYLSKQ